MQLFAAAALYLLPAPQCEHALLPLVEKVPPAQLFTVLLPSHDAPAGQMEHDARVVGVPPAVWEPGGHDPQVLAPAAL